MALRSCRSRLLWPRHFRGSGRPPSLMRRWNLLKNRRDLSALLAHVAHLRKLTSLNLGGSSVADAQLVHVEGLTALRMLSLRGTPVTDAGKVHLIRLTGLRLLDLSDTGIGDAGLAHLK